MKAAKAKKSARTDDHEALLAILKTRFEKFMTRHPELSWEDVEAKLAAKPEKLRCLQQMEATGGEPDVVDYDKKADAFVFFDCSAESPKGRYSLCYDREALDARKEAKPKNSAMDLAAEMGIELLDEDQYQQLQKLGDFDTKSSSWLKTPDDVRKRGGAIFGDRRYGRVFIYHNGAQSYYSGRGFRGWVKV